MAAVSNVADLSGHGLLLLFDIFFLFKYIPPFFLFKYIPPFLSDREDFEA